MRFQALQHAMAGRMASVRQCYISTTEERPTVQGELKVRVTVPDRGAVQLEVTRDTVSDRELTRCVTGALRDGDYRDVQRPASAFAVMTFTNTAAEGIDETAERRAQEDDVPVTRTPEGLFRATGGTPTGEVRFQVTGARGVASATVQAMQRTLRATIPGFLDCRRRAARRHSPIGQTTLSLNVGQGGGSQVQMTESTVADERGGQCVTSTLSGARFDAAAAGRGTVIVFFALRPGEVLPQKQPPRRRRP
jgi:hypothetical protein